MPKILFIFIFIFAIHTQSLDAQGITIDETTLIKDAEGKQIDYRSFIKLMNSGDYIINQKKDGNGKVYVQLFKSTKEQRAQIKKMMMSQNSGDDLVGEKAKPIEMVDMQGNKITSENTNGKIVVLNFWFIACKPCIDEMPELNEIYEKYKSNKNVVFAAITFDKAEKIKKFLKVTPYSYPIISDDRTTISAFSIQSYPTNIVIGKDGAYIYYKTGGFSGIGAHIDDAIQKALK